MKKNTMKKVRLIILGMLLSHFAVAQHHDIPGKDGIIHLERYGKGTPILIINGGPGMNSEGFRPLAGVFAKTHQAILYDQRGTGKSVINTVDVTTVTLDHMIDDIERIRKFLNIEAWIVFGHSFGGMLASYYASKHPEHIKALVLSASGGINMELLSGLNIASRLTQSDRDSLNYWNAKLRNGDTTHRARLKRGQFLAPAYVYNKSNVAVIAQRLTQGNQRINGLVWQDMRRMDFDCTPALRQFKKPVLIVHGKQDIVPTKVAEYAHSIFPNSTLKIIQECNHYGWLDQPELYFKSIREFLNTIAEK